MVKRKIMVVGIVILGLTIGGGVFGKKYIEVKEKVIRYEEQIQNSINRKIVYLFENDKNLKKAEKLEISNSIRQDLGSIQAYKKDKEREAYYNFLNKMDEDFFINMAKEKSEFFIEKYKDKMISENENEYSIGFKELCEDIYEFKN
ncbi:hypothetical protein [uncultured Clostridium sp.]|uniref:hypothetical protein n=1 Tax=uncultured Clostridium sp. TaxID=59620 RepID=UPI002637395B|nr:hypothetical protein [uncultured Clostridium sp.]